MEINSWAFLNVSEAIVCLCACTHTWTSAALHVGDCFAHWMHMVSALTMALHLLLWLFIPSLRCQSLLLQNLSSLGKRTPSFVLRACAISSLCRILAKPFAYWDCSRSASPSFIFLFNPSTCLWLLLVEKHLPPNFFPPVRLPGLLFSCKSLSAVFAQTLRSTWWLEQIWQVQMWKLDSFWDI